MGNEHDRKLAKTTAIIALGNIGTKCVNFLLLPFYTAYISREVYGTVELLSSYVTLLLPFITLQLWQAAFSFLAKSRAQTDKEKEIVSNTFLFSLFLLLVFLLAGGGLCAFIGGGVYLFVFFAVPAEAMLSLLTNTVRGLGKNALYATGKFVGSASTLLLNVLLLAVFRVPAIYILASYVIGPVLGSLYTFWRAKLWQYISFQAFRFSVCKEMLRFSVPLISNEISWWVLEASDRTIFTAIMGLSATGIIAVANRFSAIYTTIYSVFYYAWVEQCLTLYQSEEGDAYLSQAIVRMWWLFACFSMLFIAGVSIVFRWMVNIQYEAAYGLVAVYALAAFAKVMIGLTEPFLLRDNRTGMISVSAMVAGIINVIVDLLLIRRIGLYAAPLSSLTAFLLVAAWRVWIVRRQYCAFSFSGRIVLQAFLGFTFVLYAYYQTSMAIRCLFLFIIAIFCLITNRTELKGLYAMAKAFVRKRSLG